jgi:hypothetical protein
VHHQNHDYFSKKIALKKYLKTLRFFLNLPLISNAQNVSRFKTKPTWHFCNQLRRPWMFRNLIEKFEFSNKLQNNKAVFENRSIEKKSRRNNKNPSMF